MIYDELNLSDIEGWLLPVEAEWLNQRAKKSRRILEIGCFMGRSTCAMLDGDAMGPASMVVVDAFDARGTNRVEEFAGDNAVLLKKFIENVRFRGLPLPLIVVGESWQVRAFSPQFDFIFIDGSHDEQSVRDDLETARRVALPGCIVAVHDYGDKDRDGLTLAVKDFFAPVLPEFGPGSIAWGRI